MPTVRGLLHRLGVWLRGERYALEQRDEVAFHLEMERMHQEHEGQRAGDARFAARRRFGNETYYREESRRVAGFAPLDRLGQDLRPGASLFAVFALLALLVAAVGVYGVMSYLFSQRLHELGVRMALGARAADVVSLVLGAGVRVIGIGIALGVVGALVAGRFVRSLLYGVSARDPVTFMIAPLVLLVIGVVATLPAAWRATRVDPVTVLRAE